MTAAALASAADLPDACDLVVIGGGPAGLAAATLAAGHGLDVLLLDEAATLGGRIHRNVIDRDPIVAGIIGPDGDHGRDLVGAFLASKARHARGATVWSLKPAGGPGFEVAVSIAGRARLIAARRVIVATGARERPMPFPGWTLPGVMTAGAAQMALKGSGLVPDGRVVLAGSGPLLLLVADQIVAAGGTVAAVLDTTPLANFAAAVPLLPDFLRSDHFGEGLALTARVARRCRVVRGVRRLRAEGGDGLERVGWRTAFGAAEIAADLLLIHQGVVPDGGLAEAAGCDTVWDEAQRCFRPRVDAFGRSSLPGLAIAGDGAGIGGAAASEIGGRLAAIGVLTDAGRIEATAAAAEAERLRRERVWALRGRRFLDRLFRPAPAFLVPPDDATIVCRCEEKTMGEVRAAIALGVAGPNQLKTFTRCGMGPCQGRMCGATLTETIAARRGVSPAEVGALRARTPVRPVTLGEIASIPTTDHALAVVYGAAPPNEETDPR